MRLAGAVLQVAGMVAMTVAAGLVHVAAGFGVGGVLLVVAGVALEAGSRRGGSDAR